MLFKQLAVLVSLVVAGVATAQTNQLEIKDAWARATAGKTTVGAVYLSIVSPTPDRLVSASSPIANKVDLMTMGGGDGGMMKMSYLKSIDVPANKPVTLDPDGLHIWLAGLEQPLKAGESFPLTLTFEKAGQREITVSILPLAARGPTNQMQMDPKNQMQMSPNKNQMQMGH
jgi:copper(I)-binding protein